MRRIVPWVVAFSSLAGGAAAEEAWVMRAARTAAPPAIDGAWEETWTVGAPATAFRQYRPALNAPALGDTEVYVLYDDAALYVGWICYEDATDRLVASATVRDMYMNDDDAVNVMLDANNDRQSAYDLIVNWRGVRYDGSIAKDGSIGGPAWDGFWEAATSVGEGAWYCEMAIPWSTLRYDRNAGYFGIQFLRFRRATYEDTYWASDGEFINRVSTFGRVEGFGSLPRPRAFKLTPYVTGRAEEAFDTPAYGYEATEGWEFEPRGGLDFEYRAGAAAAARLTVLPDYAYIEADPARISLEPTEIYLEEKRPFFTEGYELFDTYSDTAYTRRLTEIAGGAKVAGRVGPVNYSAWDVVLRDDDPLYPEDNFALARATYDFPTGTTLGVMGIGRREWGGEVPLEEGSGEDRARYNHVGLLDGRLVLPARLGFGFEGVKSETEGAGGDGYRYTLGLGRYGLTETVEGYYFDISEDFRADTAFLQPEDLGRRGTGVSALKEFQVNRGGVRMVRPSVAYEHDWNAAGETTRNFVSPVLQLTATNDLFATLNYRGGRDARYVPYGFADFHNDVVDVAFGHRPASWGRFRLGYWRGAWYGDFYNYYTAEGDYIPIPAIVLNGNVDLGAPRGDDRFVVGNVKVTYAVTDNLYGRIILQGNSASRTSTASLLGGWDFLRGSTAYLAYEQRRDSNGRFLLAEQLAFLKVSYMITF